MRRFVVGLMPAVAVLLAGCTAGGTTGDGEGDGAPLDDPVVTVDGAAGEPAAEVPNISTEEQMLSHSAFPLDAFSLDGDFLVIMVAEHRLLAECMAEQGFDLSPFPPPGYEEAPRQPRLADKYGVGLMAEVQEYGYVPPPKYFGPPQPPPPSPLSPERQAAYELAMNGPVEQRLHDEPLVVPGLITMYSAGYAPGSCKDRTYEALQVPDYRQLSDGNGSVLVTSLVYDTLTAAQADSRSVAADGAWSACMKDKGFDASSPDEARGAYGELEVGVQIPVATADVECKYVTNYFGIRYGVETAYQKAAIEENFQQLEAIAAEHRVTLELAEAVLNE